MSGTCAVITSPNVRQRGSTPTRDGAAHLHIQRTTPRPAAVPRHPLCEMHGITAPRKSPPRRKHAFFSASADRFGLTTTVDSSVHTHDWKRDRESEKMRGKGGNLTLSVIVRKRAVAMQTQKKTHPCCGRRARLTLRPELLRKCAPSCQRDVLGCCFSWNRRIFCRCFGGGSRISVHLYCSITYAVCILRSCMRTIASDIAVGRSATC